MKAVNGGDPIKAECLLTRLNERKDKITGEPKPLLSQDQVNAGLRFASLHRKAVGLALHAKGVAFDDDTRGHYGLDESDFQKDRAQQHEAAWREARAVVKAHSRQTLDAVMNVACYERPTEQLERLKIGLNLLGLHFGLTAKRQEAA